MMGGLDAMRFTRSTLLMLLFAAACYAQEGGDKPACTRANLGMVWRETNLAGTKTAVEICTAEPWRYRWKSATVDLSELRKRSKPRGSADRSRPPAKPAK